MLARRLPSLESLRIFEACARHLNFTRAADELGLTQAAVSLRIRNLEADLGIRLFARSRPRPLLSAAGAELARDMRQVLDAVADSVARARAPDALRVTTTPTFARWLAPRLPGFTERLRACVIDLDVSVEQRKIGGDGYDLAIRSGLGGWEGVHAEKLAEIERTPMISPKLAAAKKPSAAELPAMKLLRDEKWPDWFRLAGLRPKALRMSAAKFASQDMAAEAAVAGTGVALLSPWIFGDHLRAGQLIAPFAETLRGPDAYFILTRRNAEQPALAQFVRWLKREVGKSRTVRR